MLLSPLSGPHGADEQGAHGADVQGTYGTDSHGAYGAVLMGHGSREPGTEAEIKALCATLAAATPDQRFAHAFLNQEPKLEVAVNQLIAAGCTNIRVLPLLVFTGRHMIDDVPAEITRLRALHPAVTFALEPYLFRLPGFADLLAKTLTTAPSQESPA